MSRSYLKGKKSQNLQTLGPPWSQFDTPGAQLCEALGLTWENDDQIGRGINIYQLVKTLLYMPWHHKKPTIDLIGMQLYRHVEIPAPWTAIGSLYFVSGCLAHSIFNFYFREGSGGWTPTLWGVQRNCVTLVFRRGEVLNFKTSLPCCTHYCPCLWILNDKDTPKKHPYKTTLPRQLSFGFSHGR